MIATYFMLWKKSIYRTQKLRLLQLMSRNHMEEGGSASCESIDTASQRFYECPCGKEYKSYPALFTHVKNKHNGKAPGNIKKPSLPSKRRGRPPAHKTATSLATDLPLKSETETRVFSSQVSISTIEKEVTGQDCISVIAKILNSLSGQPLNKIHLNELASILQMNVYLVSKKTDSNSLSIGNVLSQFLQQLSPCVQWERFEQMYTLLMLLVQYIIDQLQNNGIIMEGPVDLLCDYINDFMQIGVQAMTKYYEINNVGIFKEERMLEVFQAFFQWLMIKKYTNYRISLNGSFKNVESLLTL